MARPESRDARLRTYGRQRGHRLRTRQALLLDEKLPQLRIPPSDSGGCDPRRLFSRPVDAVWLEIGFGAGEHVVWQASKNPDIGFLAAEPYVNGVAKLLAAIEDHALTNIRIHDDDARSLIEWLTPACLDRVFILFPDPWPKTRHHKRRLIEQLRIASDIPDYQRWIIERMLASDAFQWLASRASDWRQRPDDWPPTRYEEKAVAAGRKPAYLTFQRR